VIHGVLGAAAAVAAEAVARLVATADAAGVRSESHHDLKIEADFLLPDLLVERLSALTGLPVVSEEDAPDAERNDAGRRWIVDPLDGTLNFSRGIPFCAVSIALWDGAVPVLGVVHDLAHGECFTGVVGEGAWRNAAAMRVSAVAEPARAVLCTGFPAQTDHGEAAVRRFVADVATFRKVRCLGSAALSLAYVACGRADVYREDDIALWDVAAGLALVRAAGGGVAFSPTSTGRRTYRVVATNGILDPCAFSDRRSTAR
jgi:myo-inositol-1(or 4)-monophosphatase